MKKRISFQFEGKTYTVDVEKHGREITIEKNGKVYHIHLLPDQNIGAAGPSAGRIQPETSVSTATTTPPAPEKETQGAETENNGTLLSPMTGVVSKLNISIGDQVQKQQVVMIIEAMKMYIDVHSPKTGTVKNIYVSEGDSVTSSQKLLEIE
ncbi:MAG: biotin/lipoyl-containing protein [Spirochaetota bacterium]